MAWGPLRQKFKMALKLKSEESNEAILYSFDMAARFQIKRLDHPSGNCQKEALKKAIQNKEMSNIEMPRGSDNQRYLSFSGHPHKLKHLQKIKRNMPPFIFNAKYFWNQWYAK